MLIIFSGLPGVGKTTVAKTLAKRMSAFYLRIDSVERVLVDMKIVEKENLNDCGYQICYSIAADNLQFGHVIADSVNPISLTRDAWRDVAIKSNSRYLEVEFICSDKKTHRNRVETRKNNDANSLLPNWEDVEHRTYEKWHHNRLVIDTAVLSVEEATEIILENISDTEKSYS
jgi:predicted kinase